MDKYKPRTRRRSRRPRKKTDDSVDYQLLVNNSNSEFLSDDERVDDPSQENFKFRIADVQASGQTCGTLIRQKNETKKSRIQLKTFSSNSNDRPVVFVSEQFSKMSIAECSGACSSNNEPPKQKQRKYPIAPVPSAKKRKPKERRRAKAQFEEYLSEEEVAQGLNDNKLIRGFIRINPKNARNSYVSNRDSSKPDYYIESLVDRNRALDGDEVVLKLKDGKSDEDKQIAAVVYIKTMIHPRVTVGTLNFPKSDRPREYAHFEPRDKRMPFLRIPAISWPNGYKENPKRFEQNLFVAKLTSWTEPGTAYGTITESLGMSGELKVETQAILREFTLDTTPVPPEVVRKANFANKISDKEFEYRLDIRKECVFTIDPITARDLDDAVSVKQLPNGNYEVGVHISDAAFYLESGTELDEIVSKKATTIYLVDNVYHMLPVEMCLFCSLLPGADKLAFSVFWEMNEAGEIFKTSFARTIINSCVQLAYEHAQMMIEDPDRVFEPNELPDIHNDFTASDLSRTVNILQKIAVNLRQQRMDNGALKIDQVKLSFILNQTDGEPAEFRVYENKEAHRLIEDFMLLANMTVARKICDTYPDLAFLRCHEEPKITMMVELQQKLETCGIHVDISSSGSIHSSLRNYVTDDFMGKCRGAVLYHLFAKPMTRARYFCAATADDEDQFKHYALSIPIYTHFTSPIRRYADIMVHRLLAATLGYCPKPHWNADYVSAIASNCNAMKYNAKRAGEASSDLYLARYVENHQPFIEDAAVIEIKERSFDVIILTTGSIVRIYPNNVLIGSDWKVEAKGQDDLKNKLFKLTITFPKTRKYPAATLIVDLFSIVKVNLLRKENTYKLYADLCRPIPNGILKQ